MRIDIYFLSSLKYSERLKYLMKYVPDTSVIVDGRFREFLTSQEAEEIAYDIECS